MRKTLKNTWKEWKPWIELLEVENTWVIIGMMADYYGEDSIKVEQVVAALAVAKWHPRNPYRGIYDCALCDQYTCDNCPLYIKLDEKCSFGSLWDAANREQYRNRKKKPYSDKLFWVLMEIYQEAWEKK